MRKLFRKAPHYNISGDMESNLNRIVEKISELDLDGKPRGPFSIADMIRATISVEEPEQLVEVYDMLYRNPFIQVVKV